MLNIDIIMDENDNWINVVVKGYLNPLWLLIVLNTFLFQTGINDTLVHYIKTDIITFNYYL